MSERQHAILLSEILSLALNIPGFFAGHLVPDIFPWYYSPVNGGKITKNVQSGIWKNQTNPVLRPYYLSLVLYLILRICMFD